MSIYGTNLFLNESKMSDEDLKRQNRENRPDGSDRNQQREDKKEDDGFSIPDEKDD